MKQFSYGTKVATGLGAVVLCIAAIGLAYFEISRIRADLATRSQNTRQLINTVSQLESRIGYGGFIHNFKNAVLRPNEPDYIAAAHADYAAANELIARIRELAVLVGIEAGLEPLERTLARYDDQLDKFSSLAEEARGFLMIDATPREPDAEAVVALQNLVARAHAQVERIVQRYIRISDWMTWLSFMVIALLALSLALILGTAYLNRVARSARENALLAEAKAMADRMLAGEMVHRLNNLMATIHSINRQTLRTSRTAKDHSQALAGRLNALNVAQNLAGERFSAPVELKHLISQLAAPYESVETAPRVTLAGVNIELPHALATQMSLVFHELLTNAMKYGALSVAGGSIAVECRQSAPAAYEVSWREKGGPPAREPEAKGFGLRFLQQVVELQMKGTCRFDFGAEGLRVLLAFPLDQPAAAPRFAAV